MSPYFTIFTPTYNRRHTLPRLINSLKHAGSVPFEWLVMDDGSNDGTYEWLLTEKAKLDFPVRVYSQPNAGKHAAHNAAIPLAKGQLVIILDSDDELAPMALNQLWASWENIAPENRDKYAGILGNSADNHNKLVGSPFPQSPLDGHQFELGLNGSLQGEKLPCYRQDILARFLFPEPVVKSVIPEGLIWNRISDQYFVRCVNAVVRIYHKDDNDSLSLMNSYKNASSNAYGKYLYFQESYLYLMRRNFEFFPHFFIHMTLYFRYGLHCRSKFLMAKGFRGRYSIYARLCFAAGFCMWVKDKISEFFHTN